MLVWRFAALSLGYSPAPVSSGYAEPPSPKQSWFAGLFNWKTALSYTLLSTESPQVSRFACRRMLEAVGVAVVVENADGVAILKCRVNELRGASFPPRSFEGRS